MSVRRPRGTTSAGNRLGSGASSVFFAVVESSEPFGGTTVRRVGKLTGFAVSTVRHHLWSLRKEGLVTWRDGASNTIRPQVRVEPLGGGDV